MSKRTASAAGLDDALTHAVSVDAPRYPQRQRIATNATTYVPQLKQPQPPPRSKVEVSLRVQQTALAKARKALEKEKARHEAAKRRAKTQAIKLKEQQQKQQEQQQKQKQKQKGVSPLPSHWEAVDPAHGNKTLVQLTSAKHAKELAEVTKHWDNSAGNGTIVRVYRVQNEAQYQRYKKALEKLVAAGKHVDGNLVCYHGTSSNPPWRVTDSDKGFDIARAISVPGSVEAIASCDAGEQLSSLSQLRRLRWLTLSFVAVRHTVGCSLLPMRAIPPVATRIASVSNRQLSR
jgi:hypothetical protein